MLIKVRFYFYSRSCDLVYSLNPHLFSPPSSPQIGFENLTMDHDKQILYVMLQSATIQDGGSSKTTSRFTRMLAYNIANPAVKPRLVGEWVVPLPLSDKNNTRACSEIHFVSENIFLALSRDGDGRGGDDNNSKYKYVCILGLGPALLV